MTGWPHISMYAGDSPKQIRDAIITSFVLTASLSGKTTIGVRLNDSGF